MVAMKALSRLCIPELLRVALYDEHRASGAKLFNCRRSRSASEQEIDQRNSPDRR